jgi:hypothetical protein
MYFGDYWNETSFALFICANKIFLVKNERPECHKNTSMHLR